MNNKSSYFFFVALNQIRVSTQVVSVQDKSKVMILNKGWYFFFIKNIDDLSFVCIFVFLKKNHVINNNKLLSQTRKPDLLLVGEALGLALCCIFIFFVEFFAPQKKNTRFA